MLSIAYLILIKQIAGHFAHVSLHLMVRLHPEKVIMQQKVFLQ